MKMKYFQNMDISKVNDNKMLLKSVKPRFSIKCKTFAVSQKGIF